MRDWEAAEPPLTNFSRRVFRKSSRSFGDSLDQELNGVFRRLDIQHHTEQGG
jgi:hypothetical protein